MLLLHSEIYIIKAGILGSILFEILCVLGCTTFAGGILYKEQRFSEHISSMMASCTTSASILLLITTALNSFREPSSPTDQSSIVLSRGISIIALAVFVIFQVFQLKTHALLFSPEEVDADHEEHEDNSPSSRTVTTQAVHLIALAVALIFWFLCTRYFVKSIGPIAKQNHITKSFLGVVLLPVATNGEACILGIILGIRNKVELVVVSIGEAILETILFHVPLLVLLGWVVKEPMELNFHPGQALILFFVILIFSCFVGNGVSNYFNGVLLIAG
jgi:Ca2+:H+ antiporter